jgi:hypothetical protein
VQYLRAYAFGISTQQIPLSAQTPKPPKQQAGEWRLAVPPEIPTAGAILSLGHSTLSLADVTGPLPSPARRHYVDYGLQIFNHLADSMPKDNRKAAEVPLLYVSHYTLGSSSGSSGGSSGGSLLGIRISHMVADFGTVAAVIYHLAHAYSTGGSSGGSSADTVNLPLPVPRPAGPAVAALAAANLPPPAGSRVFNYVPASPEWWAEVGIPVLTRPLPKGLVYHVTPDRLAALKQRAHDELAALKEQGGDDAGSSGGGGGSSGSSWVSTHDALIAHVWIAINSIPSRRGSNPTPLTLGLDMRRRMDPAACGVSLEDQGALYGNLATTLLVPAVDVARGGPGGGPMGVGAVARELRRALPRCVAVIG